MASIFDAIPDEGQEATVETAEVAGTGAETKTSKSKKDSVVRAEAYKAYNEEVNNDRDFLVKMHSLTKDIEILNTLAYSQDLSDFILDGYKPDGKKNLPSVAAIKGALLKNNGKEPVKYLTKIYKKNEEGIYVGEEVEATAKPGETFMLARRYLTLFASRVELSLVFSNAKLIIKGVDKKSVEDMLETAYIQFDKDENGNQKAVHDESVKLMVDDPDTGIVKPDYEPTFGFLMNPSEGKKKGRTAKAKTSPQEILAAYLRRNTSASAL